MEVLAPKVTQRQCVSSVNQTVVNLRDCQRVSKPTWVRVGYGGMGTGRISQPLLNSSTVQYQDMPPIETLICDDDLQEPYRQFERNRLEPS